MVPLQQQFIFAACYIRKQIRTAMINDLISNTTTDKIIKDLSKLIAGKKGGKILLDDYLSAQEKTACTDFDFIYEGSIDLQNFIKEQRRNGTNILINERDITIL